ncbi:hypothetical protein HanPSC8_Chr04g0174931 [Helianthus annuus]|nr:hypothetical protein HanIR_Chr04g0195151 [Helianthus annuus]KAJ0932550.1 hypothetical protein HanPSC8_Chr04g0174931 [Helianthus annuus]
MRFYYVTIVDCLLHIGWTRALVTLKLERRLFVFIWLLSKESINEIKRNLKYHVL